ncbi:MAG: hypothetical protein CMA77_03325 [Euryarchaeota archaeon]|nr:hypothetical protein [Euryarchaeota archaeon]
MENTEPENERPASTENWWEFVNDIRFWKGLLILGIILHLVVSFTSDLGLDAHIHATYITVEDGTGINQLDWGETKLVDSDGSDPSSAVDIGDRYAALHYWFSFCFMLFGTTNTALHIGSFVLLIATLGAVWWSTRNLFDDKAALCLTALVSIHPTFLFATGRANAEVMMLLAMVGFTYSVIMLARKKVLPAIPIMIISSFVGVSTKGLSSSLIIGVLLICILAMRIKPMRSNKAFGFGMIIAMVLCILSIITSTGGSLMAAKLAPMRFLSAILIATLDVVIIYSIFGMVLWPFIRTDDIEKPEKEVTLLAGMIGIAVTGITIYVAGQWTNYSLAWNSPWPWSTWIMGNNGRYASMLMVPAFWLIMRIRQVNSDSWPSLESPKEKSKALMMGIILVMPISLLVAFHGQTIWTEEPAEILSNNIESDEDFLFVSDATMGMHWLYTFHLEVDPYNENNITGHWRSDTTDWKDEMKLESEFSNRGNLSNVQWVVLSSGINWENAPDGWYQGFSGEIDFMNGGGEWEIWTTHGDVANQN